MKTRILMMIDSLKIGGAEVLLKDLARGLTEASYDVAVAYSTPGPLIPDFEALDVSLTHLPRLARIDPLLLRKACVVMRDYQPHILHTHLFKSDLHGRLAGALCRVPVIISTLHNEDAWAQNKIFGRIYGATARHADHLIAVSEAVRQYHIRYSCICPDSITTIPNGVDTEKFAPDPAARAALRAELRIPLDVPLVGIVGRLLPQKDHGTFLAAAQGIYAIFPKARFLIVGDGALREALEVKARQLGLGDAVMFSGIRRDIPRVMAALDVLVFSSLWEGLPVALLEGMAAALPVVSTAVGGVPGVMIDGETGLLVPPSSPEALAAACVKVLQDAQMAASISAAARHLVEERYSIQSMIQKTIDLYEKHLSQSV